MNLVNFVPKFIENENFLCTFYNFCPKLFCIKEELGMESKCLIMEKEIYMEDFLESQELEDYFIEESIED